MNQHLNLTIEGDVQGVGFRWAARSQAQAVGVDGFVRNEDDGSVTIEVEGPAEAVERFVAWCQHGPVTASVQRVKVEPAPVRGLKGFDVEF